jgi:hypothetical protein
MRILCTALCGNIDSCWRFGASCVEAYVFLKKYLKLSNFWRPHAPPISGLMPMKKGTRVSEVFARATHWIVSATYLLTRTEWVSYAGRNCCAFGLVFLFSVALPAHSEPLPLIQFRNHFSQRAGLLGRVIISSQSLYRNMGQHRHRKTRTH